MRFSTAIPFIAIAASGVSAFQAPANRVVNTLNNRVPSSNSALMAATMDGTSLDVVNGVGVGKRKKTKKVSCFHPLWSESWNTVEHNSHWLYGRFYLTISPQTTNKRNVSN